MKRLLLLCMFLFATPMVFSQTISSINLPKFQFKRGETFSAEIKTAGRFAAGNIFRIEISDAVGSFSNPLNIGEIESRDSTFLTCTIPDTMPLSKSYRIRAIATSPSYVSQPLNINILIYRATRFYVSPFGNDDNNGELATPFRTIQKGIDACWYFDTVFVFPGTYSENIVFRGIDLALVGIKGRDSTIIDGGANGNPVVILENGESSATVIDGFTVQNGKTFEMEKGAGFTIRYSTTNPVLKNLRIRNNEAMSYGGGIFCFNTGTVNIVNCIVENNKARYFGAGIYANNALLILENCIVRNNSPGGIFSWRNYNTLLNCLIYRNNSHEVVVMSDQGIQMYPKVIQSTIVAGQQYYAYYLEGRFLAELYNSIFYGKDSTIGVVGDAYDTLTLNYNIVFNYPKGFFVSKASVKYGTNNLVDDPMFLNLSAGNFALDSCSPALGMALKELAPPLDIFGYPRNVDPNDEENPDIGAVESPRQQRSSSVNISSIPKTMFCFGESFTINYNVEGCPFYAGNEFIVELSNATGSFTTSRQIGQVTSINSGSIVCSIPNDAKEGTQYKIRIRGTKFPYRSNPYPENITILGTPKVKINGDTVVCSDREIYYWTDSSEQRTNKWVIKNGISNNLLTENKVIVVWRDSASGTIKLIQTNLAGCKDSSTLKVTIHATPPKPTIEQIDGGHLVSNYPNGNQWYRNGKIIYGATGRIYTPEINGYYSVKVTSPEGCESDMSDSIFVLINSVEEENESFKVIVNNKDRYIVINRNIKDLENYYIAFFDCWGRKILYEVMDTNVQTLTVDAKECSQGVYFMQIAYRDKIRVFKIMLVE